MALTGLAVGLASGLVVAGLTKAAENSRLAIGPFAFYGNGALIVIAIGAALAIYGVWSWQLARGRPHRELAVSAFGILLGAGAVSFPSLPGMVLNGALFVLPTALAAYLVYRLVARVGDVVLAAAVVLGLVLSAPLLPISFFLQPLAMGLIVGPFIVFGARSRTATGRLLLGVALLALLLIASLVLPLPFIGSRV